MKHSKISLDDKETIRIDDSGRSLAYFRKNNITQVDYDLVYKLKEIALGLKKNVRLCLHESNEADFHDMVIVEKRGKYYKPHKHTTKEESYHIIEGVLGVFIFDDYGKIIETTVLEPSKIFLYRIEKEVWHTIIPLTSLAVFHESKRGPFIRERDHVCAEWAPEESQISEIEQYMRKLEENLNITSYLNKSDDFSNK